MTADAFEAFADTLDYPAALATAEGRLLGLNTALAQALGQPRADLRGHALGALTAEPPEKVRAYLRLCAGSRQRTPGAFTFPGAPPTVYRCEGVLLQPATPETPALLVLHLRPRRETIRQFQLLNEQIDRLNHEIHERKAVEAELRQTQNELEGRVRERTLSLEISNRELQRSNDALERFAFVASHDLSEPLRKIEAFGGMLRERFEHAGDAETRHLLARMNVAARRMRRLIDSLLELARVSTAPQTFSQVDLSAVVAEVLSDLEVSIREAGATVEVGALPIIEADATQMAQLVQNLVSNALKFRRPGVEPFVGIRSEHAGVGGPNERVHLSVEDNGIGFDSQYAQRIFRPFERLHARTAYEGVGIGLATCWQVAERHGGSIKAEGQPGQGARFTVTLPRHAAHTRKAS